MIYKRLGRKIPVLTLNYGKNSWCIITGINNSALGKAFCE
jgi:hypothetical protein